MSGVFLETLTWREAQSRFADDPLVLIPVGAAAKEHGHHLPLNTDYVTARELAERVAEVLPVVVAPVVGFGYYPVFRHYPGSQHLSAPTFIALMRELIEGFIHQGVKRLAIINTGVSTEAPIALAVREVFEAHDVRVAVADMRRLGAAARGLYQQALGGHGDEKETSVMLAIDRDAVRMQEAVTDYGNLLNAPPTVYNVPGVFDCDPASGSDYSASGVRGDPTLATAEKGVATLDAMAADLIDGLRVLHADRFGADGMTTPS